MKFRDFLDDQIKKGNTSWESRSEIIRASGSTQSGHTVRVLKEYENKFQFGSVTEIKNKEIKKYFDKQPKDSFISVEGAANQIQKELPKGIIIGETIIYNRLKDKSFNTNNLKPQTLDNQVSKTAPYDVKITKEFREKIANIIYAAAMIGIAGAGIISHIKHLTGVGPVIETIAELVKEGLSIKDVVKTVAKMV